MRFLQLSFLALLLLTAVVPAAHAQGIQIIDYLGYAWETGGILPSDPGDVLTFVGTSDWVDPLVGVDLGTEEVTFYIHDLVSASTSVDALGTTTILYSGGVLEVYRDAAKNADYGTAPPNGTAPASFTDGVLLLKGNFTSFGITIDNTGAGFFGGPADGVGGELITACTGCIYTWGGSFVAGTAQTPDGYDLQMDGVLKVDPTVPVQDERAWGSLKASYGNN